MTDRTVHAVMPDGAEIVRYNRAGKWKIERGERRDHLTIHDAVSNAVHAHRNGGEVHLGMPGGSAFDRKVRAVLAGE